jgi:hypothetical protein
MRRRWTPLCCGVTVALSLLVLLALICIGLFALRARRLSDQAAATVEAERQVERLGGHIVTGNRRGDHFVELGETSVCDEDLYHLQSYLLALPKFKELDLRGTRVSDSGLPYLEGFCSLESLVLVNTAVTEHGAKRLHRILPACAISYGRHGHSVGIGGFFDWKNDVNEGGLGKGKK